MVSSTWKAAFLVFFLYWGLCRSLRWRRINATLNKYKGRDPYSLSVEEAQSIITELCDLEMPYMVRFSSAFALFRTYGITTISKILLKTSQLLSIKTGGRRYADTERHARALARMNYIHSHYNILNDDKLYTLSVFVTAPQRWIEKYEWRPLTELEMAAWWILWREIGYQMKVENVPKTFTEMRDWADDYEKRAMIPNEQNHELAETTTGLLVYYTPDAFKGFAKKLVITLMDDRLRNAMIYPPQPSYMHKLVNYGFAFRAFLTRNFFLPRIFPVEYTQEKKNKFGRYNVNYVDNEPWYLPPEKVGFLQRFMNNLSGIPNPSPEFRMEGYVYEELGPVHFEGKGKDKMEVEVAEIMARGKLLKEMGSSGGCPLGPIN